MTVLRKASNKKSTIQILKTDLDILGVYRGPKPKLTGGVKYQTDPEIIHDMIAYYEKHNKKLRETPVRSITRFKVIKIK